MRTIFFSTILLLLSQTTFGSTLSLDFQAKDFVIKGSFTFKSGTPIRISSSDKLGNPCELEVNATIQKDDIVKFDYNLKRNNKTEDGGQVIIQKGQLAKLTAASEGHKPSIQFEAKWVD